MLLHLLTVRDVVVVVVVKLVFVIADVVVGDFVSAVRSVFLANVRLVQEWPTQPK